MYRMNKSAHGGFLPMSETCRQLESDRWIKQSVYDQSLQLFNHIEIRIVTTGVSVEKSVRESPLEDRI
jgi:hypothetical protein